MPNTRTERTRDTRTHLLAVWPGMGHVALTAGLYLMSKLRMREQEPLATGDLFDLDHIEVEKGLARAGHIPVSHLYALQDLQSRSPLGLVIGEAQPPLHKLEYCRRILDGAEQLGVGQVVTFAAMAVDAHPREASHVYGVATHTEGLSALRRHGIEVLDSGKISGMNGVFLAAAAQRGIPGLCLLGSMPAFAAHIPFPKASHAVLEAFSSVSEIPLDLKELEDYGQLIERQLTSGLEKIKDALKEQDGEDEGEIPATAEMEPPEEPAVSDADRQKIEEFFDAAARDHSKTFALKRELDRLGLFKEYENRFLDLFRRPK